ncbi:restriction endonuclease [Dokdonella koreensis]|uniref:restriction endonuclease n=1 Tax=Dokdonella koreensis TaxID=323415 RepID=UPI000A070776|nr:restriction endonuclease [Dokdonella koreensis]
MLVSRHFKLERNQATLDFLDVHIDKDIPIFVDPAALRSLKTEWGHHCVSLLQSYFESVLTAIRNGKHDRAKELLACLNERNEFHIGYSKNKSRGSALGAVSAEKIWESLVKSKAAQTGVVHDLEDTILFVDGVGPDMLSDAVCNIIRGPLIQYTQQACSYYGIPLTAGVDSGPVWNTRDEKWENSLIDLPMTKQGPLILIPKIIARVKQIYGHDEYYRHFLMPVLQQHHKDINSSLVHVLQSKKNKGVKKVYKTDLYDLYGANKLASAKLTGEHPQALTNYRETKNATPSRPLGHSALAELENIPTPNFAGLLNDVTSLKSGQKDAATYENAIEKFLSALLYPALAFPVKQDKIHEGRKRIDITYVNDAKDGFFSWASRNHPASHIFVECKNYGKEVGNPEIDQLAGRFSPSRGKLGILVVRSIDDKALLLKRCKDTANDQRGFILVLDDADLGELIKQRQALMYGYGETLLYQQFKALVS